MKLPSCLAIAVVALSSAAFAAPSNGARQETSHTASVTQDVLQDAESFDFDEREPPLLTEDALEDAAPVFEAESADPLGENNDGLPTATQPTEDELLEACSKIRLDNNEKLTALLEEKFEIKPPSDQQIRDAVKANDTSRLYHLFTCPICLQPLHSETLATTGCGHEMHTECLKKCKDFCPLCRNSRSQEEDVHKETLLKKVLEIFVDYLPPKPAPGIFSTQDEPSSGRPEMSLRESVVDSFAVVDYRIRESTSERGRRRGDVLSRIRALIELRCAIQIPDLRWELDLEISELELELELLID